MAQGAKRETQDIPPPRRNRTEAAATTTAMVGREAFARAGFRDPALVLHWASIVGTEVARICQPLRLNESSSGGVLTLKAEPGAALFLQHESRALCERINGYFGRPVIARLRFVQSPLASRPAKTPPRPAPAEVGADDSARSYDGPQKVRDALLKLARRRSIHGQPD